MLWVSFNQYSIVEEQERNKEEHLKGLLVLRNSQSRKGVGYTLVVATSFLDGVGGQRLPEDHISILYCKVSLKICENRRMLLLYGYFQEAAAC